MSKLIANRMSCIVMSQTVSQEKFGAGCVDFQRQHFHIFDAWIGCAELKFLFEVISFTGWFLLDHSVRAHECLQPLCGTKLSRLYAVKHAKRKKGRKALKAFDTFYRF